MTFLTFRWDHLRSTSGITCGLGSFAVQFGDHFRSGIICGRGSFAALYSYNCVLAHYSCKNTSEENFDRHVKASACCGCLGIKLELDVWSWLLLSFITGTEYLSVGFIFRISETNFGQMLDFFHSHRTTQISTVMLVECQNESGVYDGLQPVARTV